MSSLSLDASAFNYPPSVYDPKRRHGNLHPQLAGLIWVQRADGSVSFKLKSRRGNMDVNVKQGSVDLQAASAEEAVSQWMILSGSIDQGKKVIPSNMRTFDDGFELLRERYEARLAIGETRPSTWTKHELNYRLHVRPVFGKTPIVQVTTEQWAEFWLRCRVTNPNTRLTIKTTINRIYKRAIRKGWCFVNTHEALESDERPQKPKKHTSKARVIREDQTLAMIEHCPPLYRTMLVVLAGTGLRVSELCGLRWSDIDFDEGLIRVCGQVERIEDKGLVYVELTKTGEGRRVLLLPLAARALRAQRATEWGKGYGKDADFVWTASSGPRERGVMVGPSSGRPIAPDNFRPRAVHVASEAAGLGKVNPHDLRHTTASLFAEAGLSPAEAAQMMGHTEETYLRVYLHAFKDAQAFTAARAKLAAIGFGEDNERVVI